MLALGLCLDRCEVDEDSGANVHDGATPVMMVRRRPTLTGTTLWQTTHSEQVKRILDDVVVSHSWFFMDLMSKSLTLEKVVEGTRC